MFGVAYSFITMADEPTRAKLPRITGPYPKLAELVWNITGDVASRVAARRAGVSFETINRLRAGERVKADTLRTFAIGYNLSQQQFMDLLRSAGYFDTEPRPYALPGDKGDDIPNKSGTATEEIARILNPSEIEIVELFSGLPPELQEGALTTMRSLYKVGRTAADIVREQNQKNTFGGRRSDQDDNPSEIVLGQGDSNEDDVP